MPAVSDLPSIPRSPCFWLSEHGSNLVMISRQWSLVTLVIWNRKEITDKRTCQLHQKSVSAKERPGRWMETLSGNRLQFLKNNRFRGFAHYSYRPSIVVSVFSLVLVFSILLKPPGPCELPLSSCCNTLKLKQKILKGSFDTVCYESRFSCHAQRVKLLYMEGRCTFCSVLRKRARSFGSRWSLRLL